MSRQEVLRNIHDWGNLKNGDKVEFVHLYAGSGSLDHGQTTITYKCNAYLELSNGDVVDGYVDTGAPYCAIIVGGKVIPAPPIASTIKKTLHKLQCGGKMLADPYKRVMNILGDSVGLAMQEDDGAFHYVKSRDYKHANRMGATTIKYKHNHEPLLTYAEQTHKTRFTTSWKARDKELWKAYLRRRAFVALDPAPHWHECSDIRDVLTGLGE